MAAFNKINDFSKQLLLGTHIIGTHTFKIMLAASCASTNSVKGSLEIADGNGYPEGGATTTLALSETGGVTTVTGTEVTFAAVGGSITPFRYAVLYNDTAASDNLIGFWDYGSTVTLLDTQTFTVRFNGTTPGTIFTLTAN